MFLLGAISYQILFAARKRYRQSEESLHWPQTQGVVIPHQSSDMTEWEVQGAMRLLTFAMSTQ